MEITDLSPGGFASCCYLVTEGHDAVLVDCTASAEVVREALIEREAGLRAIVCTHGHFDHLLTADAVRRALDVPLYIHGDDAELLTDGQKNAHATFFGFDRVWRPAEQTFEGGEVLTFGKLSFRVLHTPGHTRGSSVFLINDVAFTGDTLFAAGYGRTDLYGGDATQLRRSLQALSALDGSLRIYPGHGESTTLQNALNFLY
ncbi:MAG: MBL fold metallo-hydrolase [Clostridia bacterium]|nr:MBL fold metallo-hydrolase [Clostridia bacterium]